jgi:hypothetical protein
MRASSKQRAVEMGDRERERETDRQKERQTKENAIDSE